MPLRPPGSTVLPYTTLFRSLGAWMERVDAEGQPELRAFAASLRRDLAAVTAGLTLPHTTGRADARPHRPRKTRRLRHARQSTHPRRHRALRPPRPHAATAPH